MMLSSKKRPESKGKRTDGLRSSVLKRKVQTKSYSKPCIKGGAVDAEECVQLSLLHAAQIHRFWPHFPFIFRIGDHPGSGPTLLQEVCLERGWKEYREGEEEEAGAELEGWNFWWLHNNMSARTFQSLSSWQVTNHMDKSFGFTSKDICTRYIRRLKNTYGEVYDLCPLSFNVPAEYTRLCLAHTQRKSRLFWNFIDRANQVGSPLYRAVELEKQPVWICKPVGKSQGRGITVFDVSPEHETVAELTYTTRSVVQEYITRPHLIGGYKWDLRIYVCIVSTSPLVFYAYREGLVRFATHAFDLRNLYNPYAHLTNSSLNRQSSAYFKNKTGVGRGCKWSLRKLRRYFREQGVEDWYLWQRIWAMLILIIIGDAPSISKFQSGSRARNFSLMGFDIMVDKDFRPLLAEVNSNPSLSNDSEVDRVVKKPMLHDLFQLLNLPDLRSFHSDLAGRFRPDPVHYEQPTHPIGPSSDSSEVDSDYESADPTDQREYWDERRVSVKSSIFLPTRSSAEVLYLKGPLEAFKEIMRFTADESLDSGAPESELESEGQVRDLRQSRRIWSPILVNIPIRKEQNAKKRGQPYISDWRSGLTLEVPQWDGHAPKAVGDWVRIFPFDRQTEQMSRSGRNFDVKEATRQVQEFLKWADWTRKFQVSEGDVEKDMCLADKAELTTPVWHPPFPPSSTKTQRS